MANLYYLAAVLLVLTSMAHSFLGEKYLLKRLFRRADLPKLFGGTDFTIGLLRFAWHLTSVAWLGFAAVLVLLAQPSVSPSSIGVVIGVTFAIHFLVAAIGSKGRHLSWPIFLLVAACTLYASVVWVR